MGNCICTPPSTTPNALPQEITRTHVAKKPITIHEDGGDVVECKEGIESKDEGKGIRIRVVLTQQELKEILDEYHNGESKYTSSMEELLRSALRRRRRRVRDCNKRHQGGWRPALHSIPEDA